MDKKIYSVWLALTLGAKNNAASTLYLKFGSAEKIYEHGDFSDDNELSVAARRSLLNRDLSLAERICADCEAKGVGILAYDDKLYPSRLKTLSNPPCVLYYKGKPKQLDDECVIGIVGTRAMSDYGRDVTYAFAESFAKSGAVIVSGLAAGIDAMAHKGALDAGGYTAAVLGTPIDRIYPKENALLFGEIEENGVIFSEYYPGCPTTAACFPVRNRIIAGLSTTLVVSEAGERSGALITAHDAVMQGKPVFAIPGMVGGAGAAGTNDMLRKGARMAARPYDVLSLFEYVYPEKIKISRDSYTLGENEPPPAPIQGAGKKTAREGRKIAPKPERKKKKEPLVSNTLEFLTAVEQKVLDAIDEINGSTADAVALQTSLPIDDVLSTLTVLEIYGAVRAAVGGLFFKI